MEKRACDERAIIGSRRLRMFFILCKAGIPAASAVKSARCHKSGIDGPECLPKIISEMAEVNLVLDEAEGAGDIRSDLDKPDNEVQGQIDPGRRLARRNEHCFVVQRRTSPLRGLPVLHASHCSSRRCHHFWKVFLVTTPRQSNCGVCQS
jgi:hypothetical protein